MGNLLQEIFWLVLAVEIWMYREELEFVHRFVDWGCLGVKFLCPPGSHHIVSDRIY